MTGTRTVSVVVVSAGPRFLWLAALGAACLALAFLFRRTLWARLLAGVGVALIVGTLVL